MSEDDLVLPYFKKPPKTQQKISNYFSCISNEEKWQSNKREKTSKSSNQSASTSQMDNSVEIQMEEPVKQRVSWSDTVKEIAINHHVAKNGSYADTIRDLKRLHPGTIFEALSKSVLHSWVSVGLKEKSINQENSAVKKGRKSYLPDHLLEEMKTVVLRLIESKTRITTKALLAQLKALVINKGYGDYLKVNFIKNIRVLSYKHFSTGKWRTI